MEKKNNWPNIIACSLLILFQVQAQGKPFENGEEAKKTEIRRADTLKITGDTLSLIVKSPLEIRPIEIRIFESGKHLKGVPARYQKTINGYVKHYTVRDRRLIREMQQRQPDYFPMYEANLRKHALPDELKYLSILESNLNPRAVSRCKAVGLWQFTKSTGKFYNLHQDAFRDERMDPAKSTEAACIYLKDLYRMFGDWPLALAAYNCGPGMVRRAIRHSGNRSNYWQICARLPRETQGYVPKFIALYHVMTELPRYNFTEDSTNIISAWDTIIVHKHVDVRLLSKHLDLTGKTLKELNPALKGNIVPGDSLGYSIRIPADRKDCFSINRQAAIDSAAITTTSEFNGKKTVTSNQMVRRIKHVVRSGESMSQVANRYKVTVIELKKWNHLKSQSLKKGQLLIVWQKKTKIFKYMMAKK